MAGVRMRHIYRSRTLIVLFCLLLTGFAGRQCTLVDQVQMLIDESNGTLQHTRALLVNEKALSEFGDISIALSVPKRELNSHDDQILSALKKSEDLSKAGVSVSDVSFDLDDQAIVAWVEFSVTFKGATVTALVGCAGVVSTLDNSIYLNLIARQLKVISIAGAGEILDSKLAAGVISSALEALIPIFNVALDREFNQNPKRAFIRQIGVVPVWQQKDRDKLADQQHIVLSPRDVYLSITKFLVDVNSSGIVVLANVRH
jgi:hypothetical protein